MPRMRVVIEMETAQSFKGDRVKFNEMVLAQARAAFPRADYVATEDLSFSNTLYDENEILRDKEECIFTRDQDMTMKSEGWAVFDVDGVPQILRLDDPSSVNPEWPDEPLFVDDAAALSYVAGRAAGGSSLHRDALRIHCGDDEAAMDAMITKALGK